MGIYSAYAISQSGSTEWKPGEQLVASGFVGVVLYLFIDINIGIYRIFRKKKGLYYWCMLLGTWGCLIGTIAVILKAFVHDHEPIWPLYTLFILLGWTIYAPAQLLVLYSRLHLVNQNRGHQRWILIMTIVVSCLTVIPTWPLVWQAYNPYNTHVSSIYSPREAILDRCTQIGYTIAESIVSGVYIWSLIRLLNLKSSVRQRRVFIDLVYVNLIAVGLDILTVILVFLNRTGISHPIQTFSYIIKFKLEFLVLNHLMAVAAKGKRKESFAERRYHQPSTSAEKGSFAVGSKTPNEARGVKQASSEQDSLQELVVPEPTMWKLRSASNSSDISATHRNGEHGKWPTNIKCKRHNGMTPSRESKEEDEELGVHMWKNRSKLLMEVPWFQ